MAPDWWLAQTNCISGDVYTYVGACVYVAVSVKAFASF